MGAADVLIITRWEQVMYWILPGGSRWGQFEVRRQLCRLCPRRSNAVAGFPLKKNRLFTRQTCASEQDIGWWQKPEMLGGKVAEMPPWWVCSVHPRWTSLNSESFSLATYPKYYYRCKNSFSTLAKDLSSWKVRWNFSCCTWYLSDIFPIWVIFSHLSDIFPII